MVDYFEFADDLGPSKMVAIHEPSSGLKATLAIDNVAAGPAIGGTRMAADVTTEECFRLARAMTFKNSAAGLPHGGAKSVIMADPGMAADEKEELIRAFARAIRDLTDYIPGPDMGTNEQAMAFIKDEIGRAVGLPREIGGIPLDDVGATGFGLSIAAAVAEDFCDVRIDGARVAVQGFGAVGKHAARFLAEQGGVLVAAADSKGMLFDAFGLDIEKLSAIKEDGGSVMDYDSGKKGKADSIVAADCDILIPAARPDFIRADNVETIRARLILQGANIPATANAEARLHDLGILNIPDFIANAGGVITASVEYHGGTQSAAFAAIAEKIEANTREVLEAARREELLPRTAAERLARARVERAMTTRRFHS